MKKHRQGMKPREVPLLVDIYIISNHISLSTAGNFKMILCTKFYRRPDRFSENDSAAFFDLCGDRIG